MKKMKLELASEWLVMTPKTTAGIVRRWLAIALLALLSVVPAPAFAYVQEQSAAAPSEQTSAEPKKDDNQADPEHKGIGGQLVEEKRESTGEDEEDNANLKHAGPVRWLARKTGLSVHQAHLVALGFNFAIVVIVVIANRGEPTALGAAVPPSVDEIWI